MNPDDLPPPRAGFGLQREMAEMQNAQSLSESQPPKRTLQRRDSGPRRVSFEAIPEGEEDDDPMAGAGAAAGDSLTRSPGPSTPPTAPRGLPPRAPPSTFSFQTPPSEGSLERALPPLRLQPAPDGGSPAVAGAGAAAPAPAPAPAAVGSPARSPALARSASIRPSYNATTGSDGGSEASFGMNASLRRTRRRHAAAAVTTNVLGPAPVPLSALLPPGAAVPAGVPVGGASEGDGGAESPAPPGTPPPADGEAPMADREGSVTAPRAQGGNAVSMGGSLRSSGGPAVAGNAGGSPSILGGLEPGAGIGAEGEGEGGEGLGDEGEGPPAPPITGPLYKKYIPPNALAITVARSEGLRLDPLLTDPVVRVHVLDERTGQYITTLDDPTLGALDPTQQSKMLDFPGRPTLMTASNNTDGPMPAILKVIPPIQTRPFQLLSRPELRNMAAWEEVLLIDETVERLLALDVLLLFEVLQPPVSYHRYRKHVRAYDRADGFHLIAWAFLRPAGPRSEDPHAQPQPLLGRLKLQLYEYTKDISDAVRVSATRAAAGGRTGPASGPAFTVAGGGGGIIPDDDPLARRAAAAAGTADTGAAAAAAQVAAAASAAGGPALLNAASRAYVNYQALMAKGGAAVVPKYPSALTVVLQMVPRPPPEVVITEPELDIRPYLPAGYGSGFETSKVPLSAYLSGVGADGHLLDDLQEDITKSPYYRPITEPCKVPNKTLRKLPGGPQGVTCMAFSNNGLYLAVAWAEADDRARIIIYKTLTGGTRRTIYCAHNGYVYEIAWARDDSAFITASADGTAKIWELNPVAAAAAISTATEAANAANAALLASAAGNSTADANSTTNTPAKPAGRGAAAASDAAAAAAAAAPTLNLLTTMKPRSAVSPATPPSTPPQAGTAIPGSGAGGLNASGRSAAGASVTAGTTATLGNAAVKPGDSMPHPTVLRHACYVYTAQFHPVQKQGSALVATGAYDGTVRLWRRYTGELLSAVKTQSGCINSMCFDKLGTRLYAGDSAGVLQEFSCDVTKGVEAVAAAPGGTNLKISTISAGSPSSNLNSTMMSATIRSRLGNATLRPGATPGSASLSSSPAPVNLNASMLPRSRLNASVRPPLSTAASGGDANASVRSGGAAAALNSTLASTTASTAGADSAGAAAAANIVRVLRQCDEFDGEPLSQVFLHHDGRRVGVLTKRSRMLVVETRSLSRAEQFLGVRCRECPLKAAFSPDGRYLICGSEDGKVVIWDANGGPPTLLPHFTMGGDTVFQVVWNPQFHIAAVCSFASWAPVLMLAYDPSLPDVGLQIGHKTTLDLMGRDRKNAGGARRKWEMPDKLTPEFLRLMLEDIRRDARERGILGAPNDPYGDKLVVPRSALKDLRRQPPEPPATPPPARPAGDSDGGSLRLPGSRYPTDGGSGEGAGSHVTFAEDQQPPPAAQEPEKPAEEAPPAPAPLPPAPAPAAPPEPPIQEYGWQHPQRRPEDDVPMPVPVRQQSPGLHPELYATHQRHPQYVRRLYGQEQEHEWGKQVPQLPDPLQYSQMQRAAEMAAANEGRAFPLQRREAQLLQYEQQVARHRQRMLEQLEQDRVQEELDQQRLARHSSPPSRYGSPPSRYGSPPQRYGSPLQQIQQQQQQQRYGSPPQYSAHGRYGSPPQQQPPGRYGSPPGERPPVRYSPPPRQEAWGGHDTPQERHQQMIRQKYVREQERQRQWDAQQMGGYGQQQHMQLQARGAAQQAVQEDGQIIQQGGQVTQYGGQVTQHGGQVMQYGGQTLQYGGQHLQYGGQHMQYGGQHMQVGEQQSVARPSAAQPGNVVMQGGPNQAPQAHPSQGGQQYGQVQRYTPALPYGPSVPYREQQAQHGPEYRRRPQYGQQQLFQQQLMEQPNYTPQPLFHKQRAY